MNKKELQKYRENQMKSIRGASEIVTKHFEALCKFMEEVEPLGGSFSVMTPYGDLVVHKNAYTYSSKKK